MFIPYNRLKMRLAGAVIGKNCRVYQSFFLLLKKGSTCIIGDNFTLLSGSNFNPLVKGNMSSIYVGKHGKLQIGYNVGISSSCIHCLDSIKIGNEVGIGANCLIMDTDAHSLDFRQRRRFGVDVPKCAPIEIGDDVQIGANCIILKGVTIGARSVIGAGSVVAKSIPEDCIAAGNPCKVIRFLNND